MTTKSFTITKDATEYLLSQLDTGQGWVFWEPTMPELDVKDMSVCVWAQAVGASIFFGTRRPTLIVMGPTLCCLL